MDAETVTERDLIIKLLELYKDFPCLWDLTNKNYANRDARNEAYIIMLDVLKKIDSAATVKTLKLKLDNMRTSYKRERKKVEASKTTGAGNNEVHTPSLWYFEHLSFLDEKTTPTTNVIDNIETNSSLANNDEEPATKRERAMRKKQNDILKKQSDLLDSAKILMSGDGTSADAFGNSVSSQLKELTKVQRCLAEKMISEVLFYAKLEVLTFETSIDVKRSSEQYFSQQYAYQRQVPQPSPQHHQQSSYTPSPQHRQPSPYVPSPTPSPQHRQPSPYAPSPTPSPQQRQPSPYAPSPTPSPQHHQPSPYAPSPTPSPQQGQPSPYQPSSSPQYHQPSPYQTLPSPHHHQPSPYAPSPTPSPQQRQSSPYQPSPSPQHHQPSPYQTLPSPQHHQTPSYAPTPSPQYRQPSPSHSQHSHTSQSQPSPQHSQPSPSTLPQLPSSSYQLTTDSSSQPIYLLDLPPIQFDSIDYPNTSFNSSSSNNQKRILKGKVKDLNKYLIFKK